MEFRTAIVDELNYLVAYCSELSYDEQQRILEEHPEYTVRAIECMSDGYYINPLDF